MDSIRALIRWLEPYLDSREQDIMVVLSGKVAWQYRKYVRQANRLIIASVDSAESEARANATGSVGGFLDQPTGRLVQPKRDAVHRYRDYLPEWVGTALAELMEDVLPKIKEKYPEFASAEDATMAAAIEKRDPAAWEELADQDDAMEEFLVAYGEGVAERFERLPMSLVLQWGEPIARELERSLQDLEITHRADQQRRDRVTREQYWPVVVAEYIAQFGEEPPSRVRLEDWARLQEALDHCGLSDAQMRAIPVVLPEMELNVSMKLY